ncbi:MAG: hypothetical protein J1E07_04065 [Treponema sp.]|nr:hypothetical protein [Treponema sp.]
MKRLFILLPFLFVISTAVFAAPVDDNVAYEEDKVSMEVVIPENQHIPENDKQFASVKIEYYPMYDEIRIYYETLSIKYDPGVAMNSVIACIEDFMKERKYSHYRYLRPESQKYFKDDRGQKKAQWSAHIKLER